MAGRGRGGRPYGGTNIYPQSFNMPGQQQFMAGMRANPMHNPPLLQAYPQTIQSLNNNQPRAPLMQAPPNFPITVMPQQQQQAPLRHSVPPTAVYQQQPMMPYSVPPTQSLPPTSMYTAHQGVPNRQQYYTPPQQMVKPYPPNPPTAPSSKPRKSAIRIVNPETKEEVDVGNARSSNTPTPVHNVNSLPTPTDAVSDSYVSDQAKRDQFRQQVHSTIPSQSSKHPAPNAIVSAPPPGTTRKLPPAFVPSKPIDSTVNDSPQCSLATLQATTSAPPMAPPNEPNPSTVVTGPVPLFPPVVKTEGSATVSEPTCTDTTKDLEPVVRVEVPVPSPQLQVDKPVSSTCSSVDDDSQVEDIQDTPSRNSPTHSDISSSFVPDSSEPSSLDSTKLIKPSQSPSTESVPTEQPHPIVDEPDTPTVAVENEDRTEVEPEVKEVIVTVEKAPEPVTPPTVPEVPESQSSLSSESSPSVSPNIGGKRGVAPDRKGVASDTESKRKGSTPEVDSKKTVSVELEQKRNSSSDVLHIESRKGVASDVEKEEGEISEEDEPPMYNGGSPVDPLVHAPPPGNKIYNRDFLLQFKCLVISPPLGLDKSIEVYTGEDSSYIYSHNVTRKGSRSAQGNSKRTIEYRPKTEEVDLRKAENRWVRPKDRDDGENDSSELLRKFQGILNKLTPQKFKELAEKALALPIDSEDRLRGCIDKIFQKALEEPNFSVAYANLCRVMSAIKVPTAKADDGKPKETSFRRELLTKCQKEFEKDKKADEQIESLQKRMAEATTDEEKKQIATDLEETQTKSRHRSLGNIRFIGELFKLEMLSEGIMHECIIRLLRSASDEESLECFCGLITTTGKLLDKSEAKQRLDQYFQRISDIIEKKKISSRIRFKLQDVQDLRKNEWVPRRQDMLKTIDQIHAEAKMEEIKEQEMIRNMQPSSKGYPRGEDSRRRGGDRKAGATAGGSGSGGNQDDWNNRGKGEKSRRDSTPDVSRIQGLKKPKETSVQLGPTNFRPGGWGKKTTSGTDSKDKSGKSGAPSRTSSGPKRNSGSGTRILQSRRSSTQPDSDTEKAEAIKLLKDIQSGGKSPTAMPDKFDEGTLEKKTHTIVEEFCINNDMKEAKECVKELQSPGIMHAFVREAINGTLETSSSYRKRAGALLNSLVISDLISKQHLHTGLASCLEFANDLIIDIPKLYDFLAEQLGPLVLSKQLTLHSLLTILDNADVSHRERVFAKLLAHCVTISPVDDVITLWTESKLKWTGLGLDKCNVDDFLYSEKLGFLLNPLSSSSSSSTSSAPPSFEDLPYLSDLTVMFRDANMTTDEIFEWIKKDVNEAPQTPKFIRTLTRAAVSASITGEGISARYNEEMFQKRLIILKRWVDVDEQLQLEVLNSVQVGLAFLKQPPGIISKMFDSLYNIEVVSESSLVKWRDRPTGGVEDYGRGVAVEGSKPFFKWLESADIESDDS